MRSDSDPFRSVMTELGLNATPLYHGGLYQRRRSLSRVKTMAPDMTTSERGIMKTRNV